MARREPGELVSVQVEIERIRDRNGQPACETDRATCGGFVTVMGCGGCVFGAVVRRTHLSGPKVATVEPAERCQAWPRLGTQDWDARPSGGASGGTER